MKVPFCKPSITDLEKEKVLKSLESGWLTMGNMVTEVEQKFSELVGIRIGHPTAIAVDSCTSALQLSIEALNLYEKNIAVSPITFAASANVILQTGNYPIFVDVDNCGMMDVNSPRLEDVDAILAVHYAGEVLDIDTLAKYDVPIIEDAAEAHFAKYANGKMVGNSGNLTCFSFYPTKIIAGAEGGMITGASRHEQTHIHKLRLHGLSKGAEGRYTSRSSAAAPMVEFPGYKMNMNDISASIILAQLERYECLLAGRWRVVAAYELAMYDIERKYNFIQRKPRTWYGSSVPYIYVIKVDQQEEFISFMRERDIYCGIHFTSLTTHPAFENIHGGSCPKAEKFGTRCVSLPLFTDMTSSQINHVIESMNEYCRSRQ